MFTLSKRRGSQYLWNTQKCNEQTESVYFSQTNNLTFSGTAAGMKVENSSKDVGRKSFLCSLNSTFQIFKLLGYFPIKCNKTMTEFSFAPLSFCYGFLCLLVFTGSIIYLYVDPKEQTNANSGKVQILGYFDLNLLF